MECDKGASWGKGLTSWPHVGHDSRFCLSSISCVCLVFRTLTRPFGGSFVTLHWLYRIVRYISGKLNIIAFKLKSALTKLNIIASLGYQLQYPWAYVSAWIWPTRETLWLEVFGSKSRGDYLKLVIYQMCPRMYAILFETCLLSFLLAHFPLGNVSIFCRIIIYLSGIWVINSTTSLFIS